MIAVIAMSAFFATAVCAAVRLLRGPTLADRVIALNDGKLMFEGPPEAIDDAMFKEIYGKDAERVG